MSTGIFSKGEQAIYKHKSGESERCIITEINSHDKGSDVTIQLESSDHEKQTELDRLEKIDNSENNVYPESTSQEEDSYEVRKSHNLEQKNKKKRLSLRLISIFNKSICGVLILIFKLIYKIPKKKFLLLMMVFLFLMSSLFTKLICISLFVFFYTDIP